MNEPHKFVLTFSQTLGLRSSDKNATLQNFSICYTCKKVRKRYNNNKIKIMTLAWNDEFVLSDGSYSVSDIENYIEYIIKKHERLTAISRIHVFIPWARQNLPGLLSNLTSNEISKCERKLTAEGPVRAGKRFTLFILNEDVNYIIKIIESLEDLGVLLDGVTETVKHEKKKA